MDKYSLWTNWVALDCLSTAFPLLTNARKKKKEKKREKTLHDLAVGSNPPYDFIYAMKEIAGDLIDESAGTSHVWQSFEWKHELGDLVGQERNVVESIRKGWSSSI